MATTQTSPAPARERDHDFMPLNGIDHVELWVGNAKQAAYFFTRAYGFTEVAYSGLETGVRDRTSHVLEQGRVRLVLCGTLSSDTDIAAHQPAIQDALAGHESQTLLPQPNGLLQVVTVPITIGLARPVPAMSGAEP